MTRRTLIAGSVAGLLLGAALALIGFGLAGMLGETVTVPDYRVGIVLSAVGSSPDQIPATPTTEAPSSLATIKAIGCAQKNTAAIPAGNGLLVQNTGTIQLRLSDGPLATPTWPLGPGAWVHFGFGAPGIYRVTGTRYSCSSAGIAAPHFTLDVTVTAP